MGRSNHPRKFLAAEESAQVEAAVAAAERLTSARVKVVVVRHCWGNLWAKAASIFRKAGLHQAAERHGVLILLVTTNREFLIYGDQGIHDKVGPRFWDEVRNVMAAHFAEGRFGAGLEAGVRQIGEKLAAHFPHRTGG